MQTLPVPVIRSIESFARYLAGRELPGLRSTQCDAIVPFVSTRCAGLPSVMRFGVAVISVIFGVLLKVPGGHNIVAWLCDHPLPILGEYPRLIRSLTFAFVFETWPDTQVDGGRAQ